MNPFVKTGSRQGETAYSCPATVPHRPRGERRAECCPHATSASVEPQRAHPCPQEGDTWLQLATRCHERGTMWSCGFEPRSL
jgi:predicted RNA-binding Zn-ribbon protein involved in translation (DUF1610 family)